ncbi:flagellar protein FlaF [Methanohalophilus levihalophilus]|uniref:flagellar protein FlaF n=1 Tax=Methanohalophilus levihalophilus TaxID=1431282 RepID=UPI001AEB7A88|nr:flagellar protein FlaF [Methanohalophilus levihalophilus]MBP2029983.1 flagellar protein FlaF [Methanohalophilus levihalophilus]
MGFDTIIVAFFVVTTIILVANTFAIGATNLIDSAYEGYSEINNVAFDRIHTDIDIPSIWYNDTSSHIFFTVENTGETKLSNFELWDVIVVKNGSASYLDSDDWTMSFQNDTINPGILDPLETMDVEINQTFVAGEHAIIKVSTSNGILSSAEHTVGD